MTTLHEAAQQALELCERIRDAREVWSMGELRSVCLNLRSALAQQGEQQPVQSTLFDCDIQPRPLAHPLRDYHFAPGLGPLNYTWRDKPHRLLYDLIAAVKYYAAAPAAQPVAWMHEFDDGERVPKLHPRDERLNDQPKSVRPLIYGDSASSAPAAQPACKQDLPVETEQERYVRMCPDIECGRKKQCTRMVGVSCMSRADIAAAPASLPDARKVIEQMVVALEDRIGCFEAAEVEGLSDVLAETTDERLKDFVERRLMWAPEVMTEAIAAGQQWLKGPK